MQRILTYHVVAGKVGSAQVVKMSSAKAVSGDSSRSRPAARRMVDNATVVKTDIPASNGVIHVIDAVILPHDAK